MAARQFVLGSRSLDQASPLLDELLERVAAKKAEAAHG
jgi:hypothetical protein